MSAPGSIANAETWNPFNAPRSWLLVTIAAAAIGYKVAGAKGAIVGYAGVVAARANLGRIYNATGYGTVPTSKTAPIQSPPIADLRQYAR